MTIVPLPGNSSSPPQPQPSSDDRKPQFLICVDCGQEFAFTVAAQEYFEESGFHHSPKRCKTCHVKFKREHPQAAH
ncbi:MAG: zinc-ribbon domain containing protein [Candidatus Liptonbacteria bacterium]|nr:zinc-ribbon domain containing protein [Candidatus Liptonbacteria bacterium]